MKITKLRATIVATSAVVAIGSSAALAAVTFNADSGAGFVGKGDVQLALGMNNKQLQTAANDIEFRAILEQVTEVSWICTNTKNEKIQEREQETTTSVEGVVDGVARDGKNQITGFNLLGYDGDATITSTTEGPKLNTCPGGDKDGDKWELTTPAGDPEILSSAGGLQVRNATNTTGTWIPLS